MPDKYKNWISEATKTLARAKPFGHKNPDSIYDCSRKALKSEVNAVVQILLYEGLKADEQIARIEKIEEGSRVFVIEMLYARLNLMRNMSGDVYRNKVKDLLVTLFESWPDEVKGGLSISMKTWRP